MSVQISVEDLVYVTGLTKGNLKLIKRMSVSCQVQRINVTIEISTIREAKIATKHRLVGTSPVGNQLGFSSFCLSGCVPWSEDVSCGRTRLSSPHLSSWGESRPTRC